MQVDTGKYINWHKVVFEYHNPTWHGYKKARPLYFILYPLYAILSKINSLFNYNLLNGNDDFFRAVGFVETMRTLRRQYPDSYYEPIYTGTYKSEEQIKKEVEAILKR